MVVSFTYLKLDKWKATALTVSWRRLNCSVLRICSKSVLLNSKYCEIAARTQLIKTMDVEKGEATIEFFEFNIAHIPQLVTVLCLLLPFLYLLLKFEVTLKSA